MKHFFKKHSPKADTKAEELPTTVISEILYRNFSRREPSSFENEAPGPKELNELKLLRAIAKAIAINVVFAQESIRNSLMSEYILLLSDEAETTFPALADGSSDISDIILKRLHEYIHVYSEMMNKPNRPYPYLPIGLLLRRITGWDAALVAGAIVFEIELWTGIEVLIKFQESEYIIVAGRS